MTEPIPVLKGNTIGDLIEWANNLKKNLKLATGRLISIKELKELNELEEGNKDE